MLKFIWFVIDCYFWVLFYNKFFLVIVDVVFIEVYKVFGVFVKDFKLFGKIEVIIYKKVMIREYV